jgi:hypothetical protein
LLPFNVRFEVLIVVNMKYIYFPEYGTVYSAVFTDELGELTASSYKAGLLFHPKG